MNGESAKKILDWCEKRDVERALAMDLNGKLELLRVAQVRIREAADARALGAIPPDSGLMMTQARAEATMAYEDYMAALARWKQFVIHGDILLDS